MTASPTDDLASAERRIQELTKELSEAREQQAATSEVLGIISRSQADIHHVFSAIMDCAVRLCRADLGGIYRVENGLIVPVALHPNTTEYWKVIRENFPRPVDTSSNLGRALVEGKTIHATDGQAVTYPGLSGVAKGIGFRCQLSVPLLRNGHPIGVLALMRRQPEPYSPTQIALVNTFADQAVIAIENTRLFEAEQARTRELTERTHALAEALNHQTATSDVLNIISRSPTNPQPVFDTIVKSAVRLCGALLGALYKFDGELMHVVAHHNFAPEALNALHRVFPARASRALFTGRAILERKVVHIPDVEIDDPDHKHQTLSQTIGVRSGLYVPVLREGSPIGVIAVARSEPGSFSHTQIELLKTFADQAVIAIENTRLFEEVRQKNRALTGANAQLSEALDTTVARVSDRDWRGTGCNLPFADRRATRVQRDRPERSRTLQGSILPHVPVRRGAYSFCGLAWAITQRS